MAGSHCCLKYLARYYINERQPESIDSEVFAIFIIIYFVSNCLAFPSLVCRVDARPGRFDADLIVVIVLGRDNDLPWLSGYWIMGLLLYYYYILVVIPTQLI
jgi:hypothetical protein